MKTSRIFSRVALTLFLSFLNPEVSTVSAQGNLTPPGAPAPTMTTLDQIDAKLEKRTPISSLPFTISQSGSYYLTRNLSGASGINVNTGNVVIDLNGFDLRGDFGNNDAGIQWGTVIGGVTVKNGSIRDWKLGAIDLGAARNARIENINVYVDPSAATTGTFISPGLNGLVKGCNVFSDTTVTGGGGINVAASSRVLECGVLNIAGPGITSGSDCVIENCTALQTSGIGINVSSNSVVRGCTVGTTGATGIAAAGYSLIADCTVRNPTGDGINAGSYSMVRECQVRDSGADGIQAGTGANISDCVSDGSAATGFSLGEGSVVANCTASGSDGRGFDLSGGSGAVMSHCTANANLGDGIVTGTGSTLTNCSTKDNAGAYGIFAGVGSTLIACTAHSNDVEFGIRADDRSTLTNCTSSLNTSAAADSWGISAGAQCTISECTADGNLNTNGTPSDSTGGGIVAASSSNVQHCTVVGNKGDGVQIVNDSRAFGNNCDSNGFGGNAAGIHSTGSDNRIEGNNVTDSARGIDVDSTGTLVIKNSASGNTSNYEIAAGNAVGAIVVTAASGIISGNGPFASSVGSTDPWANFSY